MTSSQHDFILTTSSFILPKTSYFQAIETSDNAQDLIFNRTLVSPDSTNLKDFFSENSIYTSPSSNTLLKNYSADKSIDNYIELIRSAATMLNGVSLNLFFDLQAKNKYLSETSFSFCVDLLTGKLSEPNCYSYYEVLPYNLRFSIHNPRFDPDKRLTELKKAKQVSFTWNMRNLLKYYAANPTVFSVIYKFIFTDNYS